MVRTTLRLRKELKKRAEKLALEKETTLQEVFNKALERYLKQSSKKKAKKLIIPTMDLGPSIDKLTRDDIYGEPDIS